MSSLSDVIGKMNFYGEINISFVSDRFNNKDSAIEINSGYLIVPPGKYFTNNFTITIWINLKSNQTWTTIIDFGNGRQQNNILLGFFYNSLNCFVFNAEHKRLLNVKKINLHEWYHISFVVNGTKGHLYLNGVEFAHSVFMLPALGTLRSKNFIGKSNWEDIPNNSNFLIDELKIFNGALSSDKIIDDYRNHVENFKKDSKFQKTT